MFKEIKEFMLRSDLGIVAAGLAIALATFSLVQAVVSYLIDPLISIFVGDPVFGVNSFRSGAAISGMAP